MAQLPEELRGRVSISAIAGPSIAGEVAIRRHTCVVFTGEDPEVLAMWKALFETDFYHVWTSTDFVEVEVCAATKNCYAFGAGFMHGQLTALGETDGQYVNFNYGAALFGQASVEMTEFMDLLGGRRSTVLGLPGIGDCFVTSMGGRNVKVGTLVGAGLTFTQARDRMPGVTLEGAAAIQVIGDAFRAAHRARRPAAGSVPAAAASARSGGEGPGRERPVEDVLRERRLRAGMTVP